MSIKINASIGTAQFNEDVKRIKDGFSQVEKGAKQTASGMGGASAQIINFSRASKQYQSDMKANAGQTANLVSQFNDISVMMAAGQSPIQLAMQQGTQISQVLTQMGGGVGALRALGGAFLGMLNPISIATIGFIALGAYIGQKLIPIIGDALGVGESLDKQLESLSKNTDTYVSAMKEAQIPLSDLRAKYGDLADEIERVNNANADFARADSVKEFQKLAQSFAKENFDSMFGDQLGDAFIPSDNDRRVDNSKGGMFDFDQQKANQQARSIEALASKIGLTTEEATKLNNTIYNSKNADNLQAQVFYFSEISRFLEDIEAKQRAAGEDVTELTERREELVKIIDEGKKRLESEKQAYEKSYNLTKSNAEELVKLDARRKDARDAMNKAIASGDQEAAKKQAALIDSYDTKIKELTNSISTESKKWASVWDGFQVGGETAFDALNNMLKKVGLDVPKLMGGTGVDDKNLVDQKVYDQALENMTKNREAGNDETVKEIVAAGALVGKALGISIKDALSLWYFESGWNPQVKGGDGGKYFGLNQFGPNEQKKYGIGPGSSIMDQAQAVIRFNQDRGFDSNIHTKENLYATTLGGNPNAIHAQDSNGTRATDVNSPKFAKANAYAEAASVVYGDLIDQSEKVAENTIRTEKAQSDWVKRIIETTANAKTEAEIVKATQTQIDLINRNSTLSEKQKRDAIIEVEVERARRIELMRLENDAKEQGINLDAVSIEYGKTYRQVIEEQAAAVGEKTRQEQIAKASMSDFKNEMKQTSAVSQQLSQTFGNIFSGIVTGTMTAKQALGQLISFIGNNLIRNLGVWGSGAATSGGWANWLFGSIGKHANGGIVNSDIQLVGERGPELAQLPRGTRVHTAQQTSNILQNAGGIEITIRSVTDGMVRQEILETSARANAKLIDKSLKVYDKGTNNRIKNYSPYES